MELSFQLIFLKYISMFFQSLIKKKQSLFTPSSPRYDSIAERKEIHINNFTHKNDKQNAQDNGVSINRSKSQKELNDNNYFIAQLKRPIIPKDHSSIKQVGVGANQQLQKHLRQHKEYNICKNKINSCDKVFKTESNTSKGGQNQRLLDMNQYQMRNSIRQISNNSHHKNLNNREFKDSGIKNCQNSQPFNCSQFSTGRKIDVYDFNEQNQSFRMKSPMSCTFPAQFNIDKAFNEYFQEETTKMSQKQYQNGDLRLMIKNLQRQLQFMARERDIDKGKLLQSSIMIDKLKFQNECIKKNHYRSKQNIDGKGRNGNQIGQLRRVLRQQLQQKQGLQKQRKNILSQLNQTLQNFEREKNRWQKQKMATQHKLDILLKQIRQKKAQNIELAQKSNRVCNENKKLRESKLLLQKQLQQKQNEVKWMNSKVNDLKQALEYFKEHGNTKIKKLEQEISHNQVKKKDNVTTEVRQLQNKLLQKQVLIQQLREQIQEHNTTINSFKQEVRTLSSSLQSKDKNFFNDQLQRLNMEIAETEKQNVQLKSRLEKQVALQQDVVMQKNKVIQALAKNVSDVNIQIEMIKRDKIVTDKQRQQLRSQLERLKIQSSKYKDQDSKIKEQNKAYLSKIGQMQNKLVAAQANLKLITSKLQQKQSQITNVSKQLQKYKQIYSSKYEESRAKQQKLRYYQNKYAQVNKQLQNSNKNIIELNKLLQAKQQGNGNAQKQIQKVRKQMCQIFEKLQSTNKQLDGKQKLLQSKNREIQNLNEQINKANIKIKNCEQKIGNMVLSSRKMEESRTQIQRRSQSLSPTHYTNSYTQLEMKLCSLLGIYLTANTQKIIAPIEQLLKNKSQMQTNNRNYQQLLKIFDTKQSTRLVLQMTEYRTTFHRLKQISQIQHNEILVLRQQKGILEDRIQYLNTMYKKLQVVVEDSNEKVMRLRFKCYNQKYNFNGLKKY